ncbi:hypothetical protein JCM16138_02040 [Thermococcus atlanticus]
MSPRCEPKGDLQQWEIITVAFPFTDSARKKPRPVLILSNSKFNRVSNSIVVCQITSNLGSGFEEYNVEITGDDVCLYEGAFIRPSLIKPYIVFSVSKREVRTRIGMLSPEKIDEVRANLRKLFLTGL